MHSVRAIVLGTFALIASTSWGQVSVSSEPVGFLKVALQGSETGSGLNLVGQSFVPEAAYSGVIDAGAPAANQITDSSAGWAANTFKTNPAVATHFIEITASGNPAAIGLVTDIEGNTVDTIVTATDFSPSLSGGEEFVVRKYKTLGDLFGAANEAGLGDGTNTTADTVSVLDADTGSFRTYYYRNPDSPGIFGIGWRSTSDPFTDASNVPIRPTEGLYIQRNRPGALTFVMSGFLKNGATQIPIEPGLNLVSTLTPLTDQSAATPVAGPRFTLGSPGGQSIVPSGLEEIFSEGTSDTVDTVSIFEGASFDTYYRRVGGVGGAGWRTTSDPFTDRADALLPAGGVLVIQNRGSGKIWNKPENIDIEAAP